MTIAIKNLGTADVKARREAALERINGGPTQSKQPGAPKRVKPSRRAVQLREPRPAETLGPTPGIYYWIGLTVAAFVMLGLVMVLSATSAREVASSDTPYDTFIRQSMWAGIGAIGLVIALKVPYHRWQPLVGAGAVLALGAMMLPFVPGVGVTVNDANSWVRFGSFGFQPSEFLKLAAIAFLADHFTRHEHDLHLPRYGLIPLALVSFGTAGISFLQGDLGAAIVLTAVSLTVAMIAGVPFRHIGMITLTGMAGAAVAVISSPWRFNRLTAFTDIEGNKDHLAFQSWQGLLSIANGGWFGSGIGGSRAKLGYLPYAHSDFIFAVIADELGFIGSVAVLGGFGLIVWFGIQAALAAPDRFGMLLAGGIAAWFGIQAVVNVGGVAGVMPVTGLTLPFFSAGGTSLCVSMVAAGLLLNVARRAVTQPRSPKRGARSHRSLSRRSSSHGSMSRSTPPRVATARTATSPAAKRPVSRTTDHAASRG